MSQRPKANHVVFRAYKRRVQPAPLYRGAGGAGGATAAASGSSGVGGGGGGGCGLRAATEIPAAAAAAV